MKHILTVFAIITALSGIAQPYNNKAQQPAKCVQSPFANRMIIPQEALMKLDATSDYQYAVRMYVHICRNSDGSNEAVSLPQMAVELQRMANFFKVHNICFLLVGQDYYDNTTINTAFNYGNASHVNAIKAFNNKTDAINIFVHKNNMVDANGNVTAGGYTYNIPGLLYSVCQASSFNWFHEMGHALGLLHTFDTQNGVECPGGGAGCSTTGDLVCDTEADFPNSEDAPRSGCVYQGTSTITCNGATRSYTPPVNNIMSYWYQCYTQFTTGQGTRMRFFLGSTMAPNNALQPSLATPNLNIGGVFGNTSTYNNEIAKAASVQINIGNLASPNNGDVAMNGSVKGLINAGSVIVMKPGTTITCNGSNKIDFIINRLCD